MDIVTSAGTGRHVASWRSFAGATSLGVAAIACEQQGQQSPRVRRRDLRNLPTDPQRPSAPSWWVT
jgi:hypothetical protein